MDWGGGGPTWREGRLKKEGLKNNSRRRKDLREKEKGPNVKHETERERLGQSSKVGSSSFFRR